MVKIAPSILSADFSNLQSDVKRAESGGADLIHIDVMDGHFVTNLTIGPVVVKGIRKATSLPFDVHLMISNPERYTKQFKDAGADIIVIHAEGQHHLHGILQDIKKTGAKAGVALNPSTPLSSVEDVLSDIDMLVIMTVNPGFGGQKFIQSLVPKIKRARDLIEKEGLNLDLEVDGGINVETAKLAVGAGANVLVAGNAVFGDRNIEENIKLIKNSV
jgi:ribulose-phosphate 3-epimerase